MKGLQYGWIIILAAILCISTSFKKEEKLQAPTNTSKIGYNLFIDETEVTNMSWLFYLYHQKTTISSSDSFLKNLKPDTSLWLNEDSIYHKLSSYYFRHPSYQNYPVVGISQKQAFAYCKWRTERILENKLIKESKTFRNTYNPSKNFTLSFFLSDSFSIIRKEADLKNIAIFSLPSSPNFFQAISYNDSVNKKHFNTGLRKYFDTCRYAEPAPHTSGSFEINSQSYCPLVPTDYQVCTALLKGLYNLQGNAAEWTIEKKLAFGGSFKSTKKDALSNPTFNQKKPAVNIGFRCIANYVPVKELLN